MRALTILTLATIAAACASQARAEHPYPYYIESYDHSATAIESELRGWGNLYRNYGEALYWDSMAAEHYQQALAQHLEIRKQLAAPHIARRERERQERARRAEIRRHQQQIKQAEEEAVSQVVVAEQQ